MKMVKRLFISTTPEMEEITGQRTKIDIVRARIVFINQAGSATGSMHSSVSFLTLLTARLTA